MVKWAESYLFYPVLPIITRTQKSRAELEGGEQQTQKKSHTILGKKKKSPPISHLQTWDLPSEQKRMPYQDWTVRSPSPAACTWTPTQAALPSLHNALINIKSLQWKAAFIGCWKYFSFSNWQAHFSSALHSCWSNPQELDSTKLPSRTTGPLTGSAHEVKISDLLTYIHWGLILNYRHRERDHTDGYLGFT